MEKNYSSEERNRRIDEVLDQVNIQDLHLAL
jgi:hypothetical protein